MNTDIIEAYETAKTDPNLQAQAVRDSNRYEERENNMLRNNNDRDAR